MKRSILYRFISKIAIVDSIYIVEIRIDVNQRSNLESEFDSMTAIQFAIPNRINLGGGGTGAKTSKKHQKETPKQSQKNPKI